MPRSSRSRGALMLPAALVAAATLWVWTASPAEALNLDVDTIGDPPPASFQACTAAANDCSLRGAIIKANSAAGPHVITLHANSYTISIQGQFEDAAATGDLDIAQAITINGVSPASTVITWDESIAAANRDRIFHVLTTGNLTIRDVSLRQGAALGFVGAHAGRGGAILALGPLTVERASIRINQAFTSGGALFLQGATVIRTSTINNNTAGNGGGIAVSMAVGVPTIPSVLIENSTISTNTADIGGGLWENAANATVTLNNATVANNTAQVAGGLVQNNGNVFLRNTIVAANFGTTSNPNCTGTSFSQGYNLVYNSSGSDSCGMTNGVNGDIVNDISGDPRLGPLQDNGGPTATHALKSLSAARDKGNPAVPGSGGNACPATDQRGLTRNIDGNDDGIARCDIGAAEGGRWLLVDTTADDPSLQTCDSNPNNGNCSLRGAIGLANAASAGSAAVITLPAFGSANPYRLTRTGSLEEANATGDLDILSDVTIVGGGALNTVIDANATDRAFHLLSGSPRALRLQDLTVRNGIGTVDGGGIFAQAPLSLLRTRVQANTASIGGGVYVSNSTLSIAESAITGNSATTGAGVHLDGSGSAMIVNSTIALNVAQGIGGGLGVLSNSTATLANVTLAGNQAANGGGAYGGGVLIARNTIIAGNTAPTNPNCNVTTTTSQGSNLDFGGSTCGFTQGTDRPNQDPMLQPLALNGGTTETMALGSGSAAIDAGSSGPPGSGGTTCAAADQRGTPRPIDGNGLNGSTNPVCDIGAYEAALCTTRPNVSLGLVPGSPGRLSVTVTAGTGTIAELRLHATPQSNIQVSINSLVNASGELVIPVNAPSKQFTIRRANGTGAGTLPFDVVDGCGVWNTLAGGGPNAWPAGASGLSTDPADASTSTPAPATPPPGCAPRRPDVALTTTRRGPGQLQTTLSAKTSPGVPVNSLHSIQFAAIHNVAVTLNGSPVTPGQTVTLPPSTQRAILTVDRLPSTPGSSPTGGGVSLVLVDACGDWKTFVGFGAAP
jgi:hypothetical protein